jgi:hypothetical protein
MNLVVQDATAIVRSRFASQTAEFLICARCGIYLGTQMEEHVRFYIIVNLGAIEGNGGFAERAEPMDYAGESSDGRRARRTSRWTPVESPA